MRPQLTPFKSLVMSASLFKLSAGSKMVKVDMSQNNWPKAKTLISGWWYTYPSEKWWSSSVGVIIPYIMKNKTCSKPPTSNCLPTIACSNPDFHYINSEFWMVLSCKGFGSGFETWFIAEIVPRFLSNVGSAYFLLKYSLIVFAKLIVQHKRATMRNWLLYPTFLLISFRLGWLNK